MSMKPAKFSEGELVEFEDFIIKETETRFGKQDLITFVNAKGDVVKKSFAGGLSEFLRNNRDAKSVMLKKVIHDGEYTMNLWSRG